MLTNSFGEVVSRRDFMPFGEELYADGTYRKTSDDYSTTGQDAVRQRFTGYQRDTETNLDFAEARYYFSRHGRFTAIDPLLASGKSANPQTFNRYVYGLNRPLVLNDPTGLQTGKSLPPEKVITPMFVDPTGQHFSTTQDNDYTPVDGTFLATSGGRKYIVTGSGYESLNGPDPVQNPYGFVFNQIEKSINSAYEQTKQWVYSISPDYCRLQLSAPLAPQFEAAMSKDFRIYSGGGISSSTFDFKGFLDGTRKFNFLNGARSIGFKPSASFNCGFVLQTLSQDQRHETMVGTTYSISGNVHPLLNLGFSKSMPIFGGTNPAFEIGIGPNTGISGALSQEALFTSQRKSFAQIVREYEAQQQTTPLK